jgi:hypothetical protein
MGWDHQERRKRLAQVGEYRPKVYRVTVRDTFDQYRLEMAAQAIRNGMSVSEFLLFAARHVVRHNRKLKHLRAVFRMGTREVLSAIKAPIGPECQEPESERDHRRR